MPEIDSTRAHPARMYDYLPGGTDHFAADREAIGALLRAVPNARTGARENRAFLGRAVRYLVASHVTSDYHDTGTATSGVHAVQRAGVAFRARSASEFAGLALTGLELVPPGVVPVSNWRPGAEAGLIPPPAEVGYYGVVARKPA